MNLIIRKLRKCCVIFMSKAQNHACSIVKTPCDTLSSGNGSPIRQNPYKNKIQTLNVNGTIHFGGTKKKMLARLASKRKFYQLSSDIYPMLKNNDWK